VGILLLKTALKKEIDFPKGVTHLFLFKEHYFQLKRNDNKSIAKIFSNNFIVKSGAIYLNRASELKFISPKG